VLQASPAPRFPGAPAASPGPIPRRGEHTEAVLCELGVAPSERDRLLSSGAVAAAAP
jgi:crotonobetainyl-CoA:carnitine CoA-transferase CaiB-like acyl-CoA transferase